MEQTGLKKAFIQLHIHIRADDIAQAIFDCGYAIGTYHHCRTGLHLLVRHPLSNGDHYRRAIGSRVFAICHNQ